MAFEWLAGMAMNVLSSAAWDGVKGAFGQRETSSILTLGLESSAPLPPGIQRQTSELETLSRIQTLLSSTESIQYLRDHDFGNAHRGAFLEPLDRFIEQTGGPEDQFLSSGLERLRQELRTAIATFQRLVGKYTFCHLQPDMYEIPGEWERNGSGLYWQAVRELNAAAAEVIRSYDVLILTARRELLR